MTEVDPVAASIAGTIRMAVLLGVLGGLLITWLGGRLG